jgi:hypothetical protein
MVLIRRNLLKNGVARLASFAEFTESSHKIPHSLRGLILGNLIQRFVVFLVGSEKLFAAKGTLNFDGTDEASIAPLVGFLKHDVVRLEENVMEGAPPIVIGIEVVRGFEWGVGRVLINLLFGLEPDAFHTRFAFDRALLGLMRYTFARVSAVVTMRVEDYYENGKRGWIRLHEKGGKRHEVPAHHNAEAYLEAYLEAAGIRYEKKSPLFRSVDRERRITSNPMTRTDVLRMVKRRAMAAGLPSSTCCHTFRATGITAYLENGGTIENAQLIAAHESPRTTKLYNRTGDEITQDEVERIVM